MQHTVTRGHVDTGTANGGAGTAAGTGQRPGPGAPGLAAVPAAAGVTAVRAVPGERWRRLADRPARWLAVSLASLAVLAGSAAVVSFSAQYQMVRAAKGAVVVPALEAGIPDVAALVFATLGIALALRRWRAVRARVLNLAAVGTSAGMNALAAGPGWRDLAIWVMRSVACALASGTAIGVVRVLAVARHRDPGGPVAGEATPLGLAGGLLRLVLAPASTLAGFRARVIGECPVAPGRRAATRPAARAGSSGEPAAGGRPRGAGTAPGVRPGTKTARFLDLVIQRFGPLAGFPLAEVSRGCSELAPAAGLHPGAARAALRGRVLAACPSAPAEPVVIRLSENGSSR